MVLPFDFPTQPHKCPRSSWVRFEATLPNERWQSDVALWKLACGRQVDILSLPGIQWLASL